MIEQSTNLKAALTVAAIHAQSNRAEFICPEHLLGSFLSQEPFRRAMEAAGADWQDMTDTLAPYLDTMEQVPEDVNYELQVSAQFNEMMKHALISAQNAEAEELDVPHVVNAMLQLEDSMASTILHEMIPCDEGELMMLLVDEYEACQMSGDDDASEPWRQWVRCLNDELEDRNPFIGREDELERTIQVLCRRQKCHPLHVGESGVGKTALVWGLAEKIDRGEVPRRLQGYVIYELDLGGVLAGAQFRGEFEKRLRMVMEGIRQEGNAIIYIDDMHNLIGAGQTGEGAMDATQLLRPYMEETGLRFIGSTTYQELNKHLSKQRSFIRRFQQIDIPEPSVEDAIQILEGLRPRFETYHGVTYAPSTMRYAVEMSAKHISDRCLPDKAIDLIDEAGAYRELHPQMRKYRGQMRPKREQVVDEALIAQVLTRICKVNAEALRADDNSQLATLASRMRHVIYGQDEAINRVVGSVEMAKAGLLDEEKPLASLLFVGPTGVGKTEVARVLAHELGIELVRFDMSEYTEKHTVAKLIGSPAGYVGYDDGGLLTDAIRKSPNCVLLLDEIEKAHADIYNILLQVMDYARLTDSKGNKADFRNVILIMTSNAGAQYASQASVGFGGGVSAGEAMLQQVKRTFKPEFLNRLSGTVVFHDMDRHMASLILDKKLAALEQKLARKQVTLQLDEDARNLLLDKGFNAQYGAREMDRVIQQLLTPLLMRDILYGTLRLGGTAHITRQGEQLTLSK